MKLGSQTNSLTNHILSHAVIGQPEPVVGMGVTILAWTDREPGTITHILKNGIVCVREDDARRIDANGMSECQKYEFTANPHGRDYHFRQDRRGVWQEVAFSETTQRWGKTGGYGLRIGERSKYHDFSF